MGSLADRPLFTHEYNELADFMPEAGSTYIYGVTSEPRSSFPTQLSRRTSGVDFVEIREVDAFTVETSVTDHERVGLRNRTAIVDFVNAVSTGVVYLDITGLGHSTWAPLVRVCLESNLSVRVVYLEPTTYALHPAPLAGEVYDLSERIDGIAPIPLFTTLSDRPEDEVCFVPLLGFEGVRFAHMLEQVQPQHSKIFPVIGVPGFRPQYPFEAYIGNAGPLERFKASRFLKLAKSNCPFSLFYLLEDVAERFPDDQMKIGLIGTKPHALGAILYAIQRPDAVEIVYDHAKRKAGRTDGTARCLVYAISEFLPADRRGLA